MDDLSTQLSTSFQLEDISAIRTNEIAYCLCDNMDEHIKELELCGAINLLNQTLSYKEYKMDNVFSGFLFYGNFQ